MDIPRVYNGLPSKVMTDNSTALIGLKVLSTYHVGDEIKT